MGLFELDGSDGHARAGTVTTGSSVIETPVFMPVGTRASVKSLTQDDLEEIGFDIILGNTYHLYLRPGDQLIREKGGLGKFMSWNRSILTDSGGFQAYSLGNLCKSSEQGVCFKSHIDGSSHLFTPEKSMEIQKNLNSDIVMCFDECLALPASKQNLSESIKLTARWAKRCRDYQLNSGQSLFAIVQGGLDFDLRMESLETLTSLEFGGYAIGGLSVGEKNSEMRDLLQKFVPKMPPHAPRYLMGVGRPTDLLHAISTGVDMFDCVWPTRNARNGQVMTWEGALNIRKKSFFSDEYPLDPLCKCKVCQRYSRSYIRHLDNVGEYLAGMLISYHNLYFYKALMERARKEILQLKFDEFYKEFYKQYESKK